VLDIISNEIFKYLNVMHLVMEFRNELEESVLECMLSVGEEKSVTQAQQAKSYKQPYQATLEYIRLEFPSLYGFLTQTLDVYVAKVEESRRDTLKFIPWKDVFILRKEQMGNLLGYTYLGSRMLVKQDSRDLQGIDMEVLVHEHIHTDDEYETRILARWMLNKDRVLEYIEKARYKLYGNKKQMDN